MTWRNGWLLTTVLSAGLVIPIWSGVAGAEGDDDENEVKVLLKDCPEAVQKTIKKEAGSGKIVEIEKEREHGKVIYEAEVVIDGKEYELTVGEDGTLIEKEEEGAEDDDEDDEDDDGAKGTKGKGGSK